MKKSTTTARAPSPTPSLDCLVFYYEKIAAFGPVLCHVAKSPELAQGYVNCFNERSDDDGDREDKTAALGAAVIEAIANGNFEEVFRPEVTS